MREIHRKLHEPYIIMLAIYAIFIAAAFVFDSPADIFEGITKIVTSRSVLLTDYIGVGGIGATLVNSALVGCISVFMLTMAGIKPNGSIIMALWLTTGFALFGKNMFNMLPITLGVYLYSSFRKEPFTNYTLAALLASTLSPVVSGLGFSEFMRPELCIYLGIFSGIFVGFIFPAVASFTMRVHSGYNLYNMGFAGGLISTFLVASLSSVGIDLQPLLIWSEGNNLELSILLYLIFVGLCVLGLVLGGGLDVLKRYPKLMKHPGKLVTDYYVLFGKRTYFNMGLTGIFATTLMLVLGCELNGPTMGGIFTIVGFSAFGKHLGNITPILLGAVISTNVNMWNPATPSNTLAILFSTGLAPIAGQFGWFWGMVAGFVHVSLVHHIVFLNNGFNLYNNGYAAGFVAMLLVPLATAFTKEKEDL